MFSSTITDFWSAPFAGGEVLRNDPNFILAINPELDDDRRVTVLETTAGVTSAALTPALAEKLELREQAELSAASFRQLLRQNQVLLHEADYLFYFPAAAQEALREEPAADRVRQLTEQDSAVFAEFQASATEQDLDDAYVELDHWAVFGSFDGERLVSASSMYPWENAPVADLGVLTLPEFRGKGHARGVVRAICSYATSRGYEPQYRCQLDNHASQALAIASGLARFGSWEVISPDSTN
ncbi:RimJ/RimL family protein N-acetyltransferase [Psychromicrobium silvestre]|uniref:RimJ/RimL family protein N-acetyltransferase n=1 Tax=Psychromicrobium silvestre TaxID=1645614 RepID=A0A7Y9S7M3_9MICC|nr:GNAT family N-acetyltransferase [Psychromicrobium silvestre]NYE95720.1 RimJ/RimL family protein N-acetyltransferase [Psychromicrobium silvestre]